MLGSAGSLQLLCCSTVMSMWAAHDSFTIFFDDFNFFGNDMPKLGTQKNFDPNFGTPP